MTPIIEQLSEDLVEDEAGSGAFGRGKKIDRNAVKVVSITDSEIRGQVVGNYPYRVRIVVQGSGLATSCDCPVGTQWCKHAVALALAVLPAKNLEVSFDDDAVEPSDPIDERLRELSREEALHLIKLMRAVPAADAILETYILEQSGTDAEVRDHVKSVITAVSRRGSGSWDYRKTMDLAMHWSDALDVVQNYLESGRGEAILPQIERAMQRINKILENADDSSGMMGDQLHRCAKMHVRACQQHDPNQKKLTDFLIKEKFDFGFPIIEWRDYAGIIEPEFVAKLEKEVATRPNFYLASSLALEIAYLHCNDDAIETALLASGHRLKELLEFYEERRREEQARGVIEKMKEQPLHYSCDFIEEKVRQYDGDEAVDALRKQQFLQSPTPYNFDRFLYAQGMTLDNALAAIPADTPYRGTFMLRAALRFNNAEVGLAGAQHSDATDELVFAFARDVLLGADKSAAVDLMFDAVEGVMGTSDRRNYRRGAGYAIESIHAIGDDLELTKQIRGRIEEIANKNKNRPALLDEWRMARLIR